MDHPNVEWIDWSTYEVKEQYNLDVNVRFNGLRSRDESDHEKCLWWEIYRTRIFKDNSYEPIDPNHFPFYLSTFPDKPYLEHDYMIRSKWGPVKVAEEVLDDLFEEINGTNYEVDHGSFKSKVLRERLPLVLQVNPSWSIEKLISLIRKQNGRVSEKVKTAKKDLENDGYVFDESQSNQKRISTHKKNLKALGHYRIGECMNLGWNYSRFKKVYGPSTYRTEKSYRENLLTFGNDMVSIKGERLANAKSLGKHMMIL